MSDLADTIDDLICSFESDGKTMDTLIMYLFCWALVGFVALAVGKFAYGRAVGYAARKSGHASVAAAAAAAAGKPGSEPDGGDRRQSHHHRVVPPTPPVGRKRLGSKTGRTSAAVASVAAGLSAVPAAAAANKAFSQEQQLAHHLRPPPVATGNDPDAVRWTNDVFKWLYNAAAGNGASGSGSGGGGGGEQSVTDYLLAEWTSALNEYTKKSFAEVRFYVKIFYKHKESRFCTYSYEFRVFVSLNTPGIEVSTSEHRLMVFFFTILNPKGVSKHIRHTLLT